MCLLVFPSFLLALLQLMLGTFFHLHQIICALLFDLHRYHPYLGETSISDGISTYLYFRIELFSIYVTVRQLNESYLPHHFPFSLRTISISGRCFFFARRAYIHCTIMILLCMFAFGGRGAFKIKIQRISSAIHYRFHFLSFYFHFCLLHALSSIQPQCCLFVRLQWHTESLLIKNNSDCDCDFDCDSEASLSHFRCLWIKWTKIA